MTTEISNNEPSVSLEKTSKENRSSNTNPSGGDGLKQDDALTVNGISNGYVDKHSKKDHTSEKHREKDKDRHRDKPRDKDREKHREKDKHGSSSSSKDKEKHSSSSSSRDKDKDKERKHKEERKDKERDHKSSSGKDKEHKSSSSSKDKDKHNSSGVSKDRDKEKHSSSSSHRDKSVTSSSSSKDKHNSSSSKDKVKHSSGEKKPSSDKDKHKSKDRESSKDRVKVKDEDRHKEKKHERTDEQAIKEPVKVKQELPEEREMSPAPVQRPSPIKEEMVKVKPEPDDDSDEDVPLRRDHKRHRPRSPFTAARRAVPAKRVVVEEDSEDDVPLMSRKKIKKEKPSKKRKAVNDDEDEDDFKSQPKKKFKKEMKQVKKEANSSQTSPRKKKKDENEPEVWKWWEEEKKEDGVKWNFLEHKGPVFAPAYEPLPSSVRFYYNGKEMRLSESAEEVATFYARMLDHDYTSKDAFNKNFFKDWRKQMSSSEQEKIHDLSKCNFKEMHAYFLQKTEERKAMSKEEKKKLKEMNEDLMKEYGFCTIDGHKEKIGNFKIEPPGLFRGRGEHPKMGMLKKRVMPEEVIINCSKDSDIPKPPSGHKWKEVRHDKNVTWLASWTENVQGQVKYVMLNPSSKLKGEKDWQKYEVARKLHKSINKIRKEYREDWKSKEMRIRQRSVALYFIDKLALRAGNEKDEDQADTVGCCSLRVEHISLHEEMNGKEWVVVFDFLGKDSIRYYNEVSVEKRVFKNLQLFMQNKSTGDDLFDRLNTTIMNKHLGDLMEGLTAKVFRTYNASITLQDQLDKLTEPDMTVQEKILAYNRANRAVAILCNHQRAVPKTFVKSMENMQEKIRAKKEQVKEAERAFKDAKRDCKNSSSAKSRIEMDKKKKSLDRLKEQFDKLNLQATDKDENKDIALGTSKLNYLDPRISVAWCKKHEVPIEKIYNKTQRSKFNWAIDMATDDYVF